MLNHQLTLEEENLELTSKAHYVLLCILCNYDQGIHNQIQVMIRVVFVRLLCTARTSCRAEKSEAERQGL